MRFARHILALRNVTTGGAALAWVLMLGVAAAGCGSSHGGGEDDAGGSDAAGTDAGDADAGTRDDATIGDDAGSSDAGLPPCPEDEAAAIDTSCESEGQVCGGPCTDECSFCNLIRCVDGHWQRMEASPAPCFDCGDSLQCVQNTEYCYVVIGGPAGSEPSYECRDAPEECDGMASCDCISVSGEASCDDSAESQVRVEVAAP